MNDQQLLKRLAETDPYPADTEMPAAAWTPEAAFTEVEDRIIAQPPGTRRPGPATAKPGWLVAAAAFIVVLIIGGVLFTTLGDRTETGPVAPTLPAPTTVPPPTMPSSTAVPTTTPPTTAAPEVRGPQTYDATLTWDGQTCTFDGPAEARVGDALKLTGVNNSSQWAFFLVLYMTSGTTIDDANHHFDAVLGNVLNDNVAGWLRPTNAQPDMVPPPEYLLVEEADAMQAGGSLAINSDDLENLRLRQPREHLFVCSSADTSAFTDDRVIDNAPQTIRVSE